MTPLFSLPFLLIFLLFSAPAYAQPSEVVQTGAMVLGGFAVYACLLMFSGVRRLKEEAFDVLYRGAVSAALFALALSLGFLVGQFATYFAGKLEMSPPNERCFKTPTFSLDNFTLFKYADWAKEGLNCAKDRYSGWVNEIAGSMATLLAVVGVAGIAPIVQNLMINFGQILMAYITAALSFGPSAVFAHVSSIFASGVLGTPLLLYLAAIGVLHERTRALASGVLGVYGASPVLTIGADVLKKKIGDIGGLGLAAWDPFVPLFWAQAAEKTFAVIELAAYAALVLAVYGALAYGISRLFDHAGVSLAGE